MRKGVSVRDVYKVGKTIGTGGACRLRYRVLLGAAAVARTAALLWARARASQLDALLPHTR